MDNLELIRKRYNVPAKRGAQVIFTSDGVSFEGVIVGSKGYRLLICINGKIKHYHPTYNLEYV